MARAGGRVGCPGGSRAGRGRGRRDARGPPRFRADWVSYEEDITKEDQLVLAAPQTSGGLLIAAREESAGMMLDSMIRAGVKDAAIIGRFESGEPGRIRVSRSVD